MDFKSFSEISRLESSVIITEKIHGTNAQIAISDDLSIIKAGSRNRWLTADDDNYGFAKWVEENKEALIRVLGAGRHFGEWYGSGINAGYGLKEKRLALFNTELWSEAKLSGLLPDRVDVVPVLYEGVYKEGVVNSVMEQLKQNGSMLVPGFMRPEGVVIRFCKNGVLFKNVFDNETTPWKQKEKKAVTAEFDAKDTTEWLQPIRLEKLLSRDERYMREYPKSLPNICRDYLKDLEKETDFSSKDGMLIKAVKKNIFSWIKLMIAQQKA